MAPRNRVDAPPVVARGHRIACVGAAAERSRGFTLLELMVAVTVLGVLLGIGVPSFIDIVQNNRVTSQTNELVSALNVARSEAIKRGVATRVSVLTAGAAFHDGWCVHLGADCDDTDSVVRTYAEMTRLSVTTVPAATTTIIFDGRGARSSPTAATFQLTVVPDGCAAGTAGRARLLDVGPTGRVSVERVPCP